MKQYATDTELNARWEPLEVEQGRQEYIDARRMAEAKQANWPITILPVINPNTEQRGTLCLICSRVSWGDETCRYCALGQKKNAIITEYYSRRAEEMKTK